MTTLFETLETRKLLSASLANGTLTIAGTAAADNIYVTIGAGSKVNVYENNVLKGSFASTSVKKIVANLGDGYYQIYIGSIGAVPSTIVGGKGDDIIAGGDGNDTLKGSDGNDRITGGRGNDNIDGGNGNDGVSGDIGNDTLFGGAGIDLMTGGEGDDIMDGGAGADTFRGGTGSDTVTYASRTNPVFVDITSSTTERGDDGEIGEHDWVEVDTENVIGGKGNDILIGTVVATGSKTGINFNNKLIGGGGNDVLKGLDGNDTLIGGDGNDDLQGGDGNDTLQGDAGIDKFSGGNGDDILKSRDSIKETLNGDAGNDSAQVDAIDILNSIEKKLA
jgi:Ca2+-binding RTX toxin-like protein